MSLQEFNSWAISQMKEEFYNKGYNQGKVDGFVIGIVVALLVVLLVYEIRKIAKK